MCYICVHFVMSINAGVRATRTGDDGHRSSFISSGPRHVSMGTDCDSARVFVVMPHHTDMIRFIKRWIREGRSIYCDMTGKTQIYPGKRYFRAIDKAIARSQLVVFTGETYTSSGNMAFDGLIAIILMNEYGLPVRPLVFVASAWKDKIYWENIIRVASTIQSSVIRVDGGNLVLSPQVVEVQPNIHGCLTLSATRGPSVPVPGECWSFQDTLDMTFKK